MKKIILLLMGSISLLNAQSVETHTFKCTDGIEHSFTGILACTEQAEGFVAKTYFDVKADNTMLVYFAVFIGDQVSEFHSYNFSPAVVSQTMDFEAESSYQTGKMIKKLMIYQDKAKNPNQGITEKTSNLCMAKTENVEDKSYSLNICFDNQERLKEFIAVYNVYK